MDQTGQNLPPELVRVKIYERRRLIGQLVKLETELMAAGAINRRTVVSRRSLCVQPPAVDKSPDTP